MITYIADIEQDIDDKIAVEWLHRKGILSGVVLDHHSESPRIKELKDIGVNFFDDIPRATEYVFCGGSLTKVNKFLTHGGYIKYLCMNGGFAGHPVVDPAYELPKFKGRKTVRTYNFNRDPKAAKSVMGSDRVNKIYLISKNVCHDNRNVYRRLHTDKFLSSYKLHPKKKLHDLLAVKEGFRILQGIETLCSYQRVDIIFKRNEKDRYWEWGSVINPLSNIKISIGYREDKNLP